MFKGLLVTIIILTSTLSFARSPGSNGEGDVSYCRNLLEGLRAASFGSSASIAGQGNTSYFMHEFEIKRDSANSIADALQEVTQNIKDPILRNNVENIITAIRAAPQSGNGNVNYWVEYVRVQEEIYLDIKNQITDLLNQTIDLEKSAVGENKIDLKGIMDGMHIVGMLISTNSSGEGNVIIG